MYITEYTHNFLTVFPKAKTTSGNHIMAITNASTPPPNKYLEVFDFFVPRGWGNSSSTYREHCHNQRLLYIKTHIFLLFYNFVYGISDKDRKKHLNCNYGCIFVLHYVLSVIFNLLSSDIKSKRIYQWDWLLMNTICIDNSHSYMLD